MNRRLLSSLLGASVAFTLTLVLVLRGEDPPPPASAAPATEQPAVVPATPTTTVEPPAAPAAAPAPAAEPAPAPAEAAPAPAPAPAAQPAPAAPAVEPAAPAMRRLDTAAEPPAETTPEPARHAERGRRHGREATAENTPVMFFQDAVIAKDEYGEAAVSIFGSTTVDGEVSNAAVSVGGSTTVNGSAGNAAVSVMGNTTVNGSTGDAAVAVGGTVVVNGHVHGPAVAVGGDVRLGPNAVVDDEVVVVGGVLQRDPGAVTHRGVKQIHLPAVSWLFAWVKSALFKARLLSFAPAASWAWALAFLALGFYLLLALIFPRAMTKCAETLEQRPGSVVLTALLMTLATPLVITLLAITGVGVFVIPVLGTCLFAARVFGRGVMQAWLGRRFTGLLGPGASAHIAMAVLIGGLAVMLLYLVPVVALIVFMLIGWLGLGTVVYTLILTSRRNGKKPAPAALAPAAPAIAAAAIGTAPAAEMMGAPAVPATSVPPVLPVAATAVPATLLPRAGFWIRVVASFLDCILLSVTAAMIHLPGVFFLLFAAYCVVLWVLKGTTIGGIICGLKVVRLDDRPVDWSVAIVRALGAFLSLAVVGLGFIWVAFDDEKQSWHDKIAGTTIVKMPKGVSLV